MTAYDVADLTDLQNMANDLAGTYTLVNDIDASASATMNGGAGFAPVGNSTTPFTGTLDGAGHVITGLVCNRSQVNAQGLFGYTSTDAVIKNVGLVNVSISVFQYAGAFVAYSNGTLEKCFSTGTVSGGYRNIGGLVGLQNAGGISDSYSTAAVTATDNNAGGITGYVNSLVPLARCYATGAVTSAGAAVGGIVGVVGGTSAVTDCYYDSETTGCTDTGKGTGKTTAEMQTLGTFTNWDFSTVWSLPASSYPILLWQVDAPAFPLKVWDGSAWADITAVKVWSGSAWVDAADVKIWDGTTWT